MLARLDSSEASFPDLQRPPHSVSSGGLSYVPIRREREFSSVSSSSYKDPSATGLGSLMTSLNLNYLLESLSPNTVSLEARV